MSHKSTTFTSKRVGYGPSLSNETGSQSTVSNISMVKRFALVKLHLQ